MDLVRLAAARRRRAQQGRYPGGTVALGYAIDPETDRYVVYEPHAELVRRVFALVIEAGSPTKVRRVLRGVTLPPSGHLMQ